ncbi:hypothetical protein BY458DRAFT_521287 [Sporodiniella umbellata]|nr:hypothetical protein BY458DRAFT_521287 [Sporodiniella umbellata]
MAVNIKNLVIFGDANSDVKSSHRELAGPLWSEYLAEAWGASLYSFGYSNSLCTNDIGLQTDNEYVPSFIDQVEGYYNLGLQLNSTETVYGIWFGMRDTLALSRQKEEMPDYKQLLECLAHTLRSISKAIGGTKFVVFNLLPIENTPFYSGTNQHNNISQLVVEINRFFEKDISNLNRHRHSVEVDVLDIHSLVKDVSEDPTLFGYKHATGSITDDCIEPCPSADDYVWFDGVHFSTAFHKTIATSIIETESFTTRANLTKKPTVQPKTFTLGPAKGVIDGLAEAYDMAKGMVNSTYDPTLEEDLYPRATQQGQHLVLVLFIFVALATFFFIKLYKRTKAV